MVPKKGGVDRFDRSPGERSCTQSHLESNILHKIKIRKVKLNGVGRVAQSV